MSTLKLSEAGKRQRKKLKEALVDTSSKPLFVRSTGEKVYLWIDLTPVERRALRKKKLTDKYDKDDKELRKAASLLSELSIAHQSLEECLHINDLNSARQWISRIEFLIKKIPSKEHINLDFIKKINVFNRLETLNLLKENNSKIYRDRKVVETKNTGMPSSDFARDHGQFGSIPSFEGDEDLKEI